jgi:hypothetical protein
MSQRSSPISWCSNSMSVAFSDVGVRGRGQMRLTQSQRLAQSKRQSSKRGRKPHPGGKGRG